MICIFYVHELFTSEKGTYSVEVRVQNNVLHVGKISFLIWVNLKRGTGWKKNLIGNRRYITDKNRNFLRFLLDINIKVVILKINRNIISR